MKKLLHGMICQPFLLKILSFLFITSNLYSQWFVQNNLNYRLYSVFFIDQNTGWVGGTIRNAFDTAVIFKTTNGGVNWFEQLKKAHHELNSLYFVNSNIGWAAGDSNWYPSSTAIVFKTTNGGANWINSMGTNSNNEELYSVYFINENTGWAAGSQRMIYKTTDGGLSWNYLYAPVPDLNNLYSVYFIDSNTGWTVGDWYWVGDIVTCKTINGGSSWVYQGFPGQLRNLYSVYFINQNTGWAAGEINLITTNGGNNWIIQSTAISLRSVRFVNQNTGWAAGGSIYKSTNSGFNWHEQYRFNNGLINSIFMIDTNTGWAAAAGGPSGGTLLKTTNGGGPIGIKLISNDVPKNYRLEQNYPNPFNPITYIEFDIPPALSAGVTKLIIYDVLGNEIFLLVNEELKAGYYKVDFDGSSLPSGVYFYKLETNGFAETRKMVLLK